MSDKGSVQRGTLYVFSAPSGCGKGTVLKEVRKASSRLVFSVSATTRQPRPGEVDGVDYHFVTKESFTEHVRTGGMLEYAIFVDNYYGTPKDRVMSALDSGSDVILEIETAGAMMVKALYPEAVLIFMLPPSVEELKTRLIKRGTDSLEVIDKRVSQAMREISLACNYDYVFVNDRLDEAVQDMLSIMKAARLGVRQNKDLIKGVRKRC